MPQSERPSLGTAGRRRRLRWTTSSGTAGPFKLIQSAQVCHHDNCIVPTHVLYQLAEPYADCQGPPAEVRWLDGGSARTAS
jgi:hypothetical protein